MQILSFLSICETFLGKKWTEVAFSYFIRLLRFRRERTNPFFSSQDWTLYCSKVYYRSSLYSSNIYYSYRTFAPVYIAVQKKLYFLSHSSNSKDGRKTNVCGGRAPGGPAEGAAG